MQKTILIALAGCAWLIDGVDGIRCFQSVVRKTAHPFQPQKAHKAQKNLVYILVGEQLPHIC
jgi:hypothetical protein